MSGFRELGNKDVKGTIDNYIAKFERGHMTGDEGRKDCEEFVNNYYDIATDFYEYGWGECFHFAPMQRNETFVEAVKRHEYYLALKLGLGKGVTVLDAGCGIGGPAVNIAGFSGCNIIGLNINKYQIGKAIALAKKRNVSQQVDFVPGSFLEIPRLDCSLDAVYAIEATVHAADQAKCYGEIFRVIKPGGAFGCYEWCLTDLYDPSNQQHVDIKRQIELGDGLPDMRTVQETLSVLERVGFTVEEWEDRGRVTAVNDVPWYRTLDHGALSVQGFRTSKLGVKWTGAMVRCMESLRLAPKGTSECHNTLCKAIPALVQGGKLGIFTPALFFLARKPRADEKQPEEEFATAEEDSQGSKETDSVASQKASSPNECEPSQEA